jgi:hypothetical protein
MSGYQEQLGKVRLKVEALTHIQMELVALQQKGRDLERLFDVVEFIRRTIKDAGPEITRRLVKAISSRAALAEQMARIKGFSQLVVISHDDTFEQDTGHVIHLVKDEQGYSRVVG